MSWTEERVERLRKLWAKGWPAARIADELGEVTRNAVIGKIYRLGLAQKRPKKPKDSGGKKRAPRSSAAAETKQNNETSKVRRDSRAEQQPPEDTRSLTAIDDSGTVTEDHAETAKRIEEESLKLSLMQLTDRTCRWPIGDPSTEDFWFCGHPSEPGKPYCKTHNRIAAQPMTTKRDKKAQRPPSLSSFSRRQ